MKRLLLVALGMALLLALASALPAAAYGGVSSATMSCTDNTSTMTRTVIVTIKWSGVKDGVDEADAQAWGGSPTVLLGSHTVSVSPPEAKGTVSMTFSFSDTARFGNVQWQLYYGAHIAPIQAGQLDASNFPGCPYP
jgi:hypothetical protein